MNKESNGFQYSPALESTSIVKIAERYEHFINGKFTSSRSGKTFATINPATEEILAKVAVGSKVDIDLAVKAASGAYKKVWSKLPAKERGKYLYRIARLMQERAREFAIIESLDNGKPIRETRDVDIP
jgi:aldehyde dehydrogenase (NAD+)